MWISIRPIPMPILHCILISYTTLYNNIFVIFQSTDLIAYLKEQLDSKEKELFVVVSREVEEKQLWMHQYALQSSRQNQGPEMAPNHCDSPIDSMSSISTYDYRNRDAECLKLTEVRNCVVSRENIM